MAGKAPGGLSWEAFESVSLEVGDWVWGTAQGAFNEKATLSQILTDAVIGMIPVVGDVTAVRDLTAVTIGLCTDPRKREDKLQWLLLVVFGLAALPVLGGVIKGVGVLLVKAIGETAKLAGQGARAAHMAKVAKDVVAVVNHLSLGNAERWLLALKFSDHGQAVIETLTKLTDVMTTVLVSAKTRIGSWLPESLVAGTDALLTGLKWLKQEIPKRIPDAIKELDETLREIQAYIRSGGDMTSKTVAHGAEAAAKEVHRVEEAILIDGKAVTRSARGGLVANSALPEEVGQYYKAEAGFPDLLKKPDINQATGAVSYPHIATYAGEIANEELKAGDQIFRVFGPADKTHGVPVRMSYAAGNENGLASFWGLTRVPEAAEEWRQGSAVLDEWNRNGFIVVGTLLEGRTWKGCTGLIAEQAGREIGSQFLRGGAMQAMLEVPPALAKEINKAGLAVIESRAARTIVLEGVRWEIKPTQWLRVNGEYGYAVIPNRAAQQVVRVGAKTVTSKRGE